MMHNKGCKCPHHIIQKIVMGLSLLAAIGFWITNFQKPELGEPLPILLGLNAGDYFFNFIVFALLGMSMSSRGLCKCCCGGCGTCPVDMSMDKKMDMPSDDMMKKM